MKIADISVVIPVYNTEEYLDECLLSVVSQSLIAVQIICVNDGSSDGSINVLKKYAESYSRIEIINLQENVGLGPARNIGIKAAKGKYITFLDSDDFLDEFTLEKLMEKLTSDTDVLLFGYESYASEAVPQSLHDHNNKHSNKGLSFFLNEKKQTNFLELLTTKSITAMAQGKLYKLDFLRQHEIEFINGKYIHEDEGWLVKWSSCSPCILALELRLYKWRIRSNSIMANIRDSEDSRIESRAHKKIVIDDALDYLRLKDSKNYKVYLRLMKPKKAYKTIKYSILVVVSFGLIKSFRVKLTKYRTL